MSRLGLFILCWVIAVVVSACGDVASAPKFDGPFEGEGKVPRPLGEYALTPVETFHLEMRDGVSLATDVYKPADRPVSETILIRTPYGREAFAPASSQTGTVATFVEHGYVVIVQDERGRGASGGRFRPLARADTDNYDTMDWITAQAWSNDVIGTFGCSSLGENQVAAAHLRHPAWKAAIPMSSSGANNGVAGRRRPFAAWNGGAFELAMGLSWFAKYGVAESVQQRGDAPARVDPRTVMRTLPVVDALDGAPGGVTFSEFVSNHPGEPYWNQFPYLKGDESIGAPALFIGSWYDYGPAGVFAQWRHFKEFGGRYADAHRVIIDPGTHCGQHRLTDETLAGDRTLGDARFDFFALHLNWFGYWLRGEDNGADRTPAVTYFRMGDNTWRSAPSWPLPGDRSVRLYLNRSLTPQNNGDGELSLSAPLASSSLAYVYDPADPVPTLAAPVCCTGGPDGDSLQGAFDQSKNSARQDVLVFETSPLSKPIDVTGPISATLFVSSDARDTDFTAKLIDVYPDGRAYNIVDGIQRMRWREGYDAPLFMLDGVVYSVGIDLEATSNLFLPGHKIRIEISSSNFPRFSRNLNTGAPNHLTSEMEKARNVVHLGGENASFITLPIIGSSSGLQDDG